MMAMGNGNGNAPASEIGQQQLSRTVQLNLGALSPFRLDAVRMESEVPAESGAKRLGN
jgi:hypothetical protein